MQRSVALLGLLLVLICQCYAQLHDVLQPQAIQVAQAEAAVAQAKNATVNITCQKGQYPPDPINTVETYIINLDLPPEQRWTEVVTAKQTEIKTALVGLKIALAGYGTMGQLLLSVVDSSLGNLDSTFPYPFAQEISGMAKALNVNLGEMVLYNIFYEISTLCTSIVAEDSNGKLYHGRNLDFGWGMGWDNTTKELMIAEDLRPLVVNLEWQRGGKTVFKSVNYAGYLGILTAVKQNAFTFSVNERGGTPMAIQGLLKWLLGERDEAWIGFLTRDVMENETTVADAKAKLEQSVMIAPVYFILGGTKPGEGYVITRDPQRAADTWEMSKARKWFILETNYDHWESPPPKDDRRDPANYCMETNIGPNNASFAGLFDVLSTMPILNQGTTYTTLMQVDSGAMETYIQDCKYPCEPF